MGRLIRTVFANDGLLIGNNLISGPRASGESASNVTFLNNLVKDLTSVFVDPERGNLHLTDAAPGIVGQGAAIDDVVDDIDGESRVVSPDIGADELTG